MLDLMLIFSTLNKHFQKIIYFLLDFFFIFPIKVLKAFVDMTFLKKIYERKNKINRLKLNKGKRKKM